MKKLVEFVKSHRKLSLIAALLVLVIVVFLIISASDWRSGRQVEKQDAQIQKQIDANHQAGEKTQAQADAHADDRKEAEGRARLAEEQRKQAAENSNRTLEPVRKARQKHEEARKSRPADYPTLTDDELCAELAKRGIPCR